MVPESLVVCFLGASNLRLVGVERHRAEIALSSMQGTKALGAVHRDNEATVFVVFVGVPNSLMRNNQYKSIFLSSGFPIFA